MVDIKESLKKLNTEDKSNLIAAINEVHSDVNTTLQECRQEINDSKADIIAVRALLEDHIINGNHGESNESHLPEESDAHLYFDEFRIGDVNMIPIVSDESEQALLFMNMEKEVLKPSATYSTDKQLRGFNLLLKEEYQHLSMMAVLTGKDQGDEFSQAMPWEEVLANGMNNEVSFPDVLEYTALTVILLDPSNTDETLIIKAYGIIIPNGEISEDENNSDNDVFMEYGYCELANTMYLEFEKRFYGEVVSVTTGVMIGEDSSLDINTNINIRTKPVYHYDTREIIGIEAYSNHSDESIKACFHVICKKGISPGGSPGEA